VSDHLRLDLDSVEDLSVVDSDHAADHLRDDNHITQMGFDGGGLLVGRGILLCLAQTLDEVHGLSLQAALETSSCARMDELDKLLIGKVKEFL